MDEAQIYERLTEIFRDIFDDDSISLTPELSAKDVDGWDSLTHIRLMLTVEKAFKVKFSTTSKCCTGEVDTEELLLISETEKYNLSRKIERKQKSNRNSKNYFMIIWSLFERENKRKFLYKYSLNVV